MTGDATLGTSAGPASRVSTSLPDLVAHVAARGVGVQPRVADPRRRDRGDDPGGALGDPGRTAGREDLDHHPRAPRSQVDVAVLVPGGEHRPVVDVAEPVFGRNVLD